MTEITSSDYRKQKELKKEVEQVQDEILDILTGETEDNELSYRKCVDKKLVLVDWQSRLDAVTEKIEIENNKYRNICTSMLSNCGRGIFSNLRSSSVDIEMNEDDYKEYKEAERVEARLSFVNNATRDIKVKLDYYRNKAEEKIKKMVSYINIDAYDEVEFLVAKTAAKEVTLHNKLISELETDLYRATETAEVKWANEAEPEWEKEFDRENSIKEEAVEIVQN